MKRQVHKLSPAAVQRAKKPGIYGDGAGLWLHVGQTGGKSWIFRFMLAGRAREMGVGPLHTIGLAEAREKARHARHLLLEGIDPLAARDERRAAGKAAAASAITFRACAVKYIEAHRAGWRSPVHAAQWSSTLETYAFPVIGDLPVALIDTGHVTKILEPIWASKTETASRVRGRIESILDYAKALGWRTTGENPAQWKGRLQNVLPPRSRVQVIAHHPALDWRRMGAFMEALRQRQGTAARAAEFATLTATRSGEARGARWSEINAQDAVWTVPPERMKGGLQHRVPLPGGVLALLGEMARLGTEGYVFPGATAKPLSDVALSKIVKLAAGENVTLHGMRAAFKTWCSERGHPDDLSEAALAHTQGKLHDAYQRGDLLDRRRKLMICWAEHCGRATPTVVTLRPAG